MKLLAVDTSTPACSAALSIDGEITENYQLAPKKHTQLILPMIDEMMAEAQLKPQQLDAVAFGCGPGSFTGVRIATGVIQGIAFACDLPVVPVSTLASIAQFHFNQADCKHAFVAMDARMGEIFWGVYQRNQQDFAELQGKEAVTPATDIVFPDVIGDGLGTGWESYQQELQSVLGPRINDIDASCLPHACAVAQLGVEGFRQEKAVPVEQALPVYLRNKVAKKESER